MRGEAALALEMLEEPSVIPELQRVAERDPSQEVREMAAEALESDVILPRTALWDLARRPPLTHAELARITDFGPWRRETYGEEILALLSRANPSLGA